MYKPDFFELYELVPEYLYRKHEADGTLENLWLMFDNRALLFIDLIRRFAGRCLINTWWWGGQSQWRGWRPEGCPEGADLSQHKYGRAFDLWSLGRPVEEIRHEIRWNGLGSGLIRRIEMNTPHLHADCGMPTYSDEIQLIYP